MNPLLTTALTIVIHTPIWVWGLYAVLLFLGYQRTRDSTVPLYRVLILPLVVAGLAIATCITGGMAGLPAMLTGLSVGSAAGWYGSGTVYVGSSSPEVAWQICCCSAVMLRGRPVARGA